MKTVILSAIVLAVGLAAAPLARAEPASPVYIPTGESAAVLVIDSETHAPVDRIDGLPAAHGLAVTPDGNRLVVGSFAERASGEAMPEKPAGVSAADHAAHHAPKPAGEHRQAQSTVSIVDVAERSVERRIDVPGVVHHVAASPDGEVAAVTHPNSDAVSVIDLAEMTVVETVSTGALPNYAVFSPDGAALYVSNSGDDEIAVVNTATWTVARRIAVGASPEHLAISPDGNALFVNNVADGTVSVVDLAKGRSVKSLAIGSTPHGIDLSDDAGTLFVAVSGADRLVAIDLGDNSRRSVPLSPAPYHLSVIDGTAVLYVSSAEEPVVWVVDAATLETQTEIPITGTGHQFAHAPGS